MKKRWHLGLTGNVFRDGMPCQTHPYKRGEVQVAEPGEGTHRHPEVALQEIATNSIG